MLVTITTELPDATDLGYLLHKHPARLQSFDLSVGTAHVFYPEATPERCTAALLLEVDAIGLARSKRFGGRDADTLGHYVNDRPYASTSMLAVALGQVFRTAMTGRCDSRPELAASDVPLVIEVTALPARGDAGLVERLFAPLGWAVEAQAVPLDPEFPNWGDSRYVNLTLTGTLRLADALRHLYVLLPVLDDAKHYWVGDDEIGKLMRNGEGWLADHPERDVITTRYLAHQRSLVRDATERLDELDDSAGDTTSLEEAAETVDAPTPLRIHRAEAVLQALRDVGAHRVADVGCGPGALLTRLVADPAFTEIVGTDVSSGALNVAETRLHLGDLSDRQRDRIRLLQSSVTYEDDRITGLDAVVLMEVVEHIEPTRLDALEATVFGHAAPASVIVTTPNSEYNALYPHLAAGTMRHTDHRFEWTRAEFADWASRVAGAFGYTVEHRSIGDLDAVHGSPTQLALFRRV
ncbi:3' terminal RNA ribose 2'-O-methyltransferase Hen1 [Frondihabitans sp. PAMC 28766]|uniref:3' terminal RNA ribose 2'-O-methyltransferase Hen1 n=1 Tax=Frondihabitans sp. PAMC 28766 TaxID=1795630 RepID=UPI00078E8994|nr:3' terminal RNA ribose 2'-O-methyltransferase Hen1 [Frondihabitans sp. PAMC 28766]AMM21295.1 3' terminal RNA ribose 2'-O-methyltransferase Hen1 [Frondihabitans sp. PAMC 28766]